MEYPPRSFCKWPYTLIGSKPNFPKSYNLVEDDGLSSYCRIWDVVVCTCACCCGDGKCGGDHPIIYGFGGVTSMFSFTMVVLGFQAMELVVHAYVLLVVPI